MHKARRTFVGTGTAALLAVAGVTAAIAADSAPPPPPRIAFLANGVVHADALAAGPIAGQLGAPMYITEPDALSPAAATGLDDYDPELVIVLGGPVAVHDSVIGQVENATGLSYTDAATPAGGIVRAAGGDRFDTAAAVADLLTAYNPAFMPINMQSIDADLLDGKDSSAFLGTAQKAADSDKLDGMDAAEFLRANEPIDADSVSGLTAVELQIPAMVPPGRMLTGMHSLGSSAEGAGERMETYVSFPFPLAADPSGIHVLVNGNAAPECPGDIYDPAADPGHLCIWINTYGSTTPSVGCVGGVSGGIAFCNSPHGAKDGFMLTVNSAAVGDYGQRGTWAVTAPASSSSAASTSASPERSGEFDAQTQTQR